MRILTHLSSLIFLLVAGLPSLQAQGPDDDRQYLDGVLASTTRRNAAYYRVNEGRDGENFIGKTYTVEGKLKAEGRYVDAALTIAHGPFVFYHANGKVESKGVYVNGNKSGVWERFDVWGQPLAEKIYDPEPLANIIYTRAQTMPQFAQGDERAFVKYIREKVTPADGPRLKGTVTTSFIVEKNGDLTEVKVVDGKDEVLDDRVVDAVRSTSPWQPGAEKGLPVRVQMRVPVQF